LLAKLITYGESREQAIGRVRRALEEYFIGGVRTNLPLFRQILANADFLAGNTDTGLLDRMPERKQSKSKSNDESIAAIAAGIFSVTNSPPVGSNHDAEVTPVPTSSWKKAARTEALR
jgi:acetyl-CoA carboxylase biotin carboxylase subunit